MNHGPLLRSVDDTRRQLNLGRTAFYKLVSTGRLRVVKLGRRTLVRDEDLREFVAGLTDQSEAAQ